VFTKSLSLFSHKEKTSSRQSFRRVSLSTVTPSRTQRDSIYLSMSSKGVVSMRCSIPSRSRGLKTDRLHKQ
ncbi:hypothetical protein OF83DRAFT_1139640, partial [Amylostereum chailletii]